MRFSTSLKIGIITLLSACACLIANATDASASTQIAQETNSLWSKILTAGKENQFSVFASAIFLLAIIHAFFYGEFLYLSKHIRKTSAHVSGAKEVFIRFLHFLSEVEIVFALWLIPLLGGFAYCYGWESLTVYLDDMAYQQERFAEPIFVLVIMSISATRPIVDFASSSIERFAKLGGNSVKAWWCAILIVGTMLGSLITEPAAITICAMLLGRHFFKHEPSNKFKYATLGLLLVAISIGGAMTPFAAPPVLMVKKPWDWNFIFMLTNFAWKVAIAITISVCFYAFIFKKEFATLQKKQDEERTDTEVKSASPTWLIVCHLAFLGASILLMHYSIMIILLFFAFLAFLKITKPFQDKFEIESPLLVCIFLASLVIHGSFQSWWIEPVLSNLGEVSVFLGSIVLTSFNDNAAITYLATLAPNFPETSRYLIVAGALAGGGLTLIANAPNLAGASILKKHFGETISPLNLFYGALPPTIIATGFFYILQ